MGLTDELHIKLRVVFFNYEDAQRAQHDLPAMLFPTGFQLQDSRVEDKLLLFEVHRPSVVLHAAPLLPMIEEWAQSFGGNCC